jgi:enediyne biosynthesis protein E8
VHDEKAGSEKTHVPTIEAFADTILPGAKRWPTDHAVAGVSADGGAVAGGALPLLEDPASGFAEILPPLAERLNEHAREFADARGLSLDDTLPVFVALDHSARVALLQQLLDPAHPEKEMFVGLAMFSTMAFDSAAHLDTREAIAQGHPGLLAIGYSRPGADGLWRFPEFSYGRALAPLHPLTTTTGNPA